MSNKSILLISSFFPGGHKESWLSPELTCFSSIYKNVYLLPRSYVDVNHCLPINEKLCLLNYKLISFTTIFYFFKKLRVLISKNIFSEIKKQSNGFFDLIKRLSVIPKACLISELIKKNNINHIHAYTTTSAASMGVVISLLNDIDFSFTVHTSTQLKSDFLESYKALSIRSKFIRTISDKTKHDLKRFLDGETTPIHCIKLGVSLRDETVNIAKNSKIFLPRIEKIVCVGVLENYKRFDLIIQAMPLILAQHSNCELHIFGDGSLAKSLNDLVIKLNISTSVIFHGYTSHDVLMERLVDFSGGVLVLPSFTNGGLQEEGIPVVLMEALNNQILPISTFNGGIPEIITDNLVGFLVDKPSYELFSYKVLEVFNMSDAEFYSMLVKGSQAVFEKHDVMSNAIEFEMKVNKCLGFD